MEGKETRGKINLGKDTSGLGNHWKWRWQRYLEELRGWSHVLLFSKGVDGDVLTKIRNWKEVQVYGNLGRHDFNFSSFEFKAANKNVNFKRKLRWRGMEFERWLKNSLC